MNVSVTLDVQYHEERRSIVYNRGDTSVATSPCSLGRVIGLCYRVLFVMPYYRVMLSSFVRYAIFLG